MRPMIELTTSSINKHQLSSVDYLHLPYLPFDLVEQILFRLPVNTLLRIRCVCKSFNSLISDPKFAKKHLCMSTMRRIHFSSYSKLIYNYIITSCPLDYVFTSVPTNVTQIMCPYKRIVGSCNGILCLVDEDYNESISVLLWNLSIRKSKVLSTLCCRRLLYSTYGFGYDFVTDNYKVVAFLTYNVHDSSGDFVGIKSEMKVNTLGTNSWKNIQDFPFDSTPCTDSVGRFVSGTINWLASKDWHIEWQQSSCFIVSLDLGKESYKKILLPDCGEVDVSILYLSVLRDCLCMIYGNDIWVMKEYENSESWIKLFSVPYMKSYNLTKIYMFEDNRVLLESKKVLHESTNNLIRKLNVYDPRSGTLKFVKFQNKSVYDPMCGDGPEIYTESLISP